MWQVNCFCVDVTLRRGLGGVITPIQAELGILLLALHGASSYWLVSYVSSSFIIYSSSSSPSSSLSSYSSFSLPFLAYFRFLFSFGCWGSLHFFLLGSVRFAAARALAAFLLRSMLNSAFVIGRKGFSILACCAAALAWSCVW